MTRQEIEQLAEKQWEGCQGCDENDKYFWINGFVVGYLNARVENLEEKVELSQKKIAELLINKQ
jgi:hypothetical protein